MNPEPGSTTPAVVETPLKPRRRRWKVFLALLLVIIALGVGGYFLGWYKPLLDRYNAAAITLKIKEEDKYELEGAKLTVDGHDYLSAVHGKIALNMVAGSYPYTLTKDGYKPGQGTLTLKRGDNELQILSLTKLPDQLYTVQGYVQDAFSGQAIADVQVTLGSQTVQTDPGGAFSFASLPAGDIKLVLSKVGYRNKEQTATIAKANLTIAKMPLTPDGQLIFVSNADGKRGLYAVAYDGSNRHAFVPRQGTSEDLAPVISPDSKNVMFSSTRDGLKDSYGNDLMQLYLASQDGQTVKKVSGDSAPQFTPIWSPNSQWVYFSGYSTPKADVATYRVYNVKTGATLDLGETTNALVFGTDGNTVYYLAYSTQDQPAATPSPTGGSSRVAVYTLKSFNLTTGERKVLAQGGDYMSDLRLAADGKSVSYEALQTTGRFRYSVSLADGTQSSVDLLTDNRTYYYAPDNSKKVFIELRDGKTDLYLVDANGQNEKRLTTFGVVDNTALPHWDESGKYISFAVKREAENAIYMVSTAGGDPKKVTDYAATSN